MPILNVYKPKGLTPLQIITLLRKKFPEYKNETIAFAGRLDPLAHGVLLLMIGEETTKQREKYLNLPKGYEFEAVFGIGTDTYDTLGIVNNVTMKQFNNDLKDEIEKFIKNKHGKQIQTYPPYSSKTVYGKPLYQWARENKLHEIKIPKREIEIYNFELIKMQTISAEKFENEIMKQINSVSGDFRQEQIRNAWGDFFAKNQLLTSNYQTARFKLSCSSGTYVRSLIHELGNQTDMEAIALEILRTDVGPYHINDSLQFT